MRKRPERGLTSTTYFNFYKQCLGAMSMCIRRSNDTIRSVFQKFKFCLPPLCCVCVSVCAVCALLEMEPRDLCVPSMH